MSFPYDAKMVTAILRKLPAEKLSVAQPHDFQRHPAPIILRGQILAEMIANERARRKA